MAGYKIFTSGKMSGLSYEESMTWRKQLENAVLNLTDKKVVFIHPPEFFGVDDVDQSRARHWEINQLANSDIVVVDLSTIKDSIGTHIELGIVEGINRTRDKKIEIMGIGVPNTDHSWVKEGLTYWVSTIQEAAEIINNLLLM
ncbi:MAG: hypothetical protein II453_17820 [Alphaproteobacteria bacterium]|nr:hypothetical protein [Alphaproteobacteria bacterium]